MGMNHLKIVNLSLHGVFRVLIVQTKLALKCLYIAAFVTI